MNKRNLILQSAVVAAIGALAYVENASASSVTSTAVTYATQAIPATGAITIPAGMSYVGGNTSGTAIDAGLITFTLPTGVTFVSTPALTGTNCTAAVGGGGATSNSLTVNITGKSTAACTVTLGSFQITGATALATAQTSGNFEISAQASGFTSAANNDATAVTGDLAISASQLQLTAAANNITIDVGASVSTATGNQYVAAVKTATTAGYLGSVQASTNGYKNAANTAAFTFTATTASVAVGANMTGIASAYADSANATCASTKPATGIAGTISGNTVTFSGLSFTSTYGICLVPNGTALLQQTPVSATVTATADTTTTSTNNAGTTQTLGSILYNGTAVTLNYVVATSSGYSNYIRVNMPAGVSGRVIVSVQKDDGTTTTGTLATNQAAGTSALYTPANINTAVGSTVLSTATDRARVTVLSPSGITAQNLMFNPGGVVVSLP